jgi:hypothetical protein
MDRFIGHLEVGGMMMGHNSLVAMLDLFSTHIRFDTFLVMYVIFEVTQNQVPGQFLLQYAY